MNRQELLALLVEAGGSGDPVAIDGLIRTWTVRRNLYERTTVDAFRSDMLALAANALTVVARDGDPEAASAAVSRQIDAFQKAWDGEHSWCPHCWADAIHSYLCHVRPDRPEYRARMVKVAAKAAEAVMSVDKQRADGGVCFYED